MTEQGNETFEDSSPSRLSPDQWRVLRANHRTRVEGWTRDRVSRANHNLKHPIYDFLFTYYPFRPSHLERWSPGADVLLEGCTLTDVDWPGDFQALPNGVVLPSTSFPAQRATYLAWAARYLDAVASRPPSFCCFGLHEWAMVYRCNRPRHEQVPLRLAASEIEAVVNGSDLRCTHYDAFRFFTPEAVPLNKFSLSRDETSIYDQRGCIHVTMDLYKFAHKIAPWCSSDLIADAFLLAVEARTIDMRASPYDLSSLGFKAIRIESAAGREEYVQEQRQLAERATPIRTRLLAVYRSLVEASRFRI